MVDGAETGPVSESFCEVCGSQRAAPVIQKNGYSLVRCECGFVYVGGNWLQIDFQELYANRYPPSAFMPQERRKLRKGHHELATLEKLTTGRSLLDVGTSYGFFLVAARSRGWQASGVELSPISSDYARRTNGLNVFTGLLQDSPFQPRSFDVITIRHVLEHVPDPRQLLELAARYLKRGGLLLVAVPNLGSLAARCFGSEWWWIDPPTHLTYFTATTLDRLLRSCGFNVIHQSTARGDDEHSLFYALFAINRRFQLKRRLGGIGGVSSKPAGNPEQNPARDTWRSARYGVSAAAWLTRPIGVATDHFGLGSELLQIARARP